MHILPAYYTTTNTRKRKPKARTLSQIESDRRTQELLRKVGYYKRDNTSPRKLIVEQVRDDRNIAPLSNTIPGGVAPKAEAKEYSGEMKLLGIATMHKSNMVPVFSKESASEISKMRRG